MKLFMELELSRCDKNVKTCKALSRLYEMHENFLQKLVLKAALFNTSKKIPTNQELLMNGIGALIG
jgi:hypothetical protein